MDKGTLDALMSEDTAEVRESGEAMLREVKRVLKPAGRSVSLEISSFLDATLLLLLPPKHARLPFLCV